MIYLRPEDLSLDARQTFIDHSTDDSNAPVQDEQELRAIELVKSYLCLRYDVATIFDEDQPLRDPQIVEVLVKIILYNIFRRNASRKVSPDAKEDFQWALKQLEKWQTGRLTLPLPAAPTDDDSPSSDMLWGSTSNDLFYI